MISDLWCSPVLPGRRRWKSSFGEHILILKGFLYRRHQGTWAHNFFKCGNKHPEHMLVEIIYSNIIKQMFNTSKEIKALK